MRAAAMRVRYLFRPWLCSTLKSGVLSTAYTTSLVLLPTTNTAHAEANNTNYSNYSNYSHPSYPDYKYKYNYDMASTSSPRTVSPGGHVRALSADSTKSEMVPITREYLAEFYKKFPDPVFSKTAAKAHKRAIESGEKLSKKPVPKPDAPHRMDEGMFAARCACEEAVFALKDININSNNSIRVEQIIVALDKTARRFQQLQDKQRKHAMRMVTSFLPSDIRGRLFSQASARSEARSAAALKVVEDAILSGEATVRDKYDLLWKQQYERRENLSAIGNASGAFKLLVRYLGGVPEPLLDFARKINTPDGPTEEIRVKFGPTLVKHIDAARCCASLAESVAEILQNHPGDKYATKATKALGELAIELLIETEQFCELLETVVENSPFFLPAVKE